MLLIYRENDIEQLLMVNAFPWLFPGGIGDLYDPYYGKTSIKQWAKHLLHYCDGRFQSDHMFCWYVFNRLQRHRNNSSGNHFINGGLYYGKNNIPVIEDLQHQLKNHDTSFINKIQYFARRIRGTDSYWNGKKEQLEQ